MTVDPTSEPTVADLATKIDELTDLFRRRLLDDRDKRSLIQQLSERAERAERFRERAALRPLVSQLALVVDRLDAGTATDPVLSSYADEILDVLALHGVVQIGQVGEAVDPRWHEIVEVEGAPQERRPVADFRVVQVARRGFRLDELVVRPSAVVVAPVPDRSAEPTVLEAGDDDDAG